MGSFLPVQDAALLAWATNCSALVSASSAMYGVPTATATSFAAAVASFQTALAACEPGVRSKSSVAAKNVSRDALKVQARAVAKLVDGTLTVSDAQKIELGLNVRKAPQPIPVPATSPVVEVLSVNQNVVQLKLGRAGSSKRGRPPGVNGAIVISYVGENPPADPSLWKAEGVVSQTQLAITFPLDAEPFSKVWIAAAWFNPSKETGLMCTPISTYLGSWVVESAASTQEPMLKAA